MHNTDHHCPLGSFPNSEYASSGLRFLRARMLNSPACEVAAAASSVLIYRDGEIFTVAQLLASIIERLEPTGLIYERWTLRLYEACRREAESLDIIAGPALMHHAGFTDVDLAALQREASEATNEAWQDLYGST